MQRSRVRALAALVLGATAQAQAIVPPYGTATLSNIDADHVEIVYQGRDVTLRAANFAQTIAAIAAVYGVPLGPWNPSLVDIAMQALGVPFLRARSCWPNDGSFVIVPTAPAGLADAALQAASQYYDPNAQPREFANAYWNRMFSQLQGPQAPPGWPGRPEMEELKQQLVDAIPFPANLGEMQQYQARGMVPFMHVYGDYDRVCFLFICWYMPKCKVRFRATAEGYGLRDVR